MILVMIVHLAYIILMMDLIMNDGLCDAGDGDDDNDGALDGVDSNDNNPNICSDSDG